MCVFFLLQIIGYVIQSCLKLIWMRFGGVGKKVRIYNQRVSSFNVAVSEWLQKPSTATRVGFVGPGRDAWGGPNASHSRMLFKKSPCEQWW